MRIYTKVEEPAAVTVLMPYVKANHRLQLVVDCLRIQQVQPRLEKVDDGDAYWRLLSGMWALGEEFFVVEHDVAVWMGAIRQLKECPEDWCTLPTLCHGRMITTTFGCIKFGQRLIERRPGFWDDIPTTWFHLDANFTDKMGWPFIKPHAHFPPATHLNEVQWPDEVSVRYSLERKLAWQSIEEGRAVAKVQFRVEGDTRKLFRRRRSEHVSPAEVSGDSVTISPSDMKNP